MGTHVGARARPAAPPQRAGAGASRSSRRARFSHAVSTRSCASPRPPHPPARPPPPPQTAREVATRARAAARALQALPSATRTAALGAIAAALESHAEEILAENAADVAAATGNISAALLQRLVLTPAKIAQLAAGVRAIAAQAEPLGRALARTELAEGLVLEKVSSPIGVLLVIFEARPDALPQIAALALRSGNGLLLKGGTEAARSNAVLHRVVADALAAAAPAVGRDALALVSGRAAVAELLALDDVIDLVIPRGSNALVAHIKAHTRIPVLGHADGVCHVYVDAAADDAMAAAICVDAKVDYPAACNAVETILVHASWRGARLEALLGALRAAGVALHGGPRAAAELGLPPAPALHHEWSSLDVTIELVDSLDAAIDHIHAHGSGHSEAIVTADAGAADAFLARVDSACVYHNASPRFSDGFRFGLGAEVGIATGRIHARGPVGVEGLLTTRWLVRGRGQVVAKDKGIAYTHRALPLGE